MTVPAPKLTPPLEALPGRTIRLAVPMLAMVRWIAFDEPRPSSIMAMTAATPMTIPSAVSAARKTLRRRPLKAVCSVPLSRPPRPPPIGRASGRVAAGGAIARCTVGEAAPGPFASIMPSRIRMMRRA
jgi:hypothetical protein